MTMADTLQSAYGERPAISVALCTYNGERYLPAQLESIAAQTRLPDELVVCDDASTDRTAKMVRSFARSAPFPVRLTVNAANLGSNANFEQAICLCRGEFIALSDQDDIWFPSRLERSAWFLEHHPPCGLVFADGEIIDGDGRLLNTRLWQQFHFDPPLKDALWQGDYRPLARFRFITGATVMFRARFRPYLFPILGEWVHDGWIANLIACLSGICFVDEPLIYYRRHERQQIGLGGAALRRRRNWTENAARHWLGIDAHRAALADLCVAFDRLPQDAQYGAAAEFRAQQRFLVRRLTLPARRAARLFAILALLPEYQRGALGLLSAGKDLLVAKQADETGCAERSGFSLFKL
jgi:glycosyltransferase involved in cell wall biosynthesis